MNIFFDLDGTLLDSRSRLHGLFQNLVPQSCFSFDEYWSLKRNRTSHKQILAKYFGYDNKDIEAFQKDWMSNIESEYWLEMDIPFQGVTEYLNKTKEEHTLYVVTARQSKAMATRQIDHFGWINIFEAILVTEQKLDKYSLITNAVEVSNTDWLVGDTGKDIQTGKLLNMNTAAVLSGFLNRHCLAEYEPDLVVDDVTKLNFKIKWPA
jgi:phosphoglycolate phosphatase